MRAWLGIVAFAALPNVLACEPKPFAPDVHVTDAQFVGIGAVTGERLPSYEKRVLETGVTNEAELWEERLVRIALVERLGGQVQDAPLEVVVPCGAPYPELRERVVYGVSSTGDPWVFAADYTEADARRVSGK